MRYNKADTGTQAKRYEEVMIKLFTNDHSLLLKLASKEASLSV